MPTAAEPHNANPVIAPDAGLAAEDLLRAQAYRLLARFLSAPPQQADLDAAAALEGDDGRLGRAISAFARIARRTTPAQAADEFHVLFIGLGRGELVPYGSYYLTGFLHEKPLAKLRQDMARIGIERGPAVSEPEDHVASLAEIMAGLIEGTYGAPMSLAEQERFYRAHVGCWAPYFFRDLAEARASVLYSALGAVGSAFLEIEENAFRLD